MLSNIKRNSQAGFKRFNIVSIPIYLIVLSMIYLGWKYFPVYWQREELIELSQNAILSSHRGGPDGIATAIWENAKDILGLKLDWEDIKVTKYGKVYSVKINYTVKIKHPFGYETVHPLSIKTERSTLN